MMTETSSCSELEKPTKNRGDDRGFELPQKSPAWFQRAKQVQDQVIPDYILYSGDIIILKSGVKDHQTALGLKACRDSLLMF